MNLQYIFFMIYFFYRPLYQSDYSFSCIEHVVLRNYFIFYGNIFDMKEQRDVHFNALYRLYYFNLQKLEIIFISKLIYFQNSYTWHFFLIFTCTLNYFILFQRYPHFTDNEAIVLQINIIYFQYHLHQSQIPLKIPIQILLLSINEIYLFVFQTVLYRLTGFSCHSCSFIN